MFWKKEHLLLRSKCSIFHNILKNLTFQKCLGGVKGKLMILKKQLKKIMANKKTVFSMFDTVHLASEYRFSQVKLTIVKYLFTKGEKQYQLKVSRCILRDQRQ